jgi:hypothetical protein
MMKSGTRTDDFAKCKVAFIGLIFLCCLVAGSCRTTRVSRTRENNFKYSYCTPTITYESPAWPDTGLSKIPPGRLSTHDSLLSSILGIGACLGELLTIPADSAGELLRLSLKQKIDQRILVAQTESAAVVAELDCEGERASLAAIYLDNLNSRYNRRLTVASVVAGALTTAATALITQHNAQATVGISGGLISAALALSTINPQGRKIEFFHERNLLRPIWDQAPVNTGYPLFVWKMLHTRQFSNSGSVTLAESIRSRWLQFELNGKADKDKEGLLFGGGGYYHSGELHTRAAMLSQLQSTIRSINQDLASLVILIGTL